MGTYLLSGLPGTGKTTIGNELIKRGFEVINTDDELGYNGDIETATAVEKPATADHEWFKNHGWVWNYQKFLEILQTPRQTDIFFAGGSRDEKKYYCYFDKIFVLYAPNKIMRQRLEARGFENLPSPFFIDRMIKFNNDTFAHTKSIGGILIDTSESLETCLRQIVQAL